jgi:hypothetical protein
MSAHAGGAEHDEEPQPPGHGGGKAADPRGIATSRGVPPYEILIRPRESPGGHPLTFGATATGL